jgi:hypothetical protein
MKFEETHNGFKPFSIIVETQEEANYLYALVFSTSPEVEEAFSFKTNELYEYLEKRVNPLALPTVKSIYLGT